MMSLTINKTIETPYVHLEEGLIKMEGRSMPENVMQFYAKINEWINKYIQKPLSFTKIDLFLSYLNSCSTKHICELLTTLNTCYLEGNEMKVIWTYEEGDESTLEIGYDLESMVDIPFEYIENETSVKQRKRLKVKNLKTGKIGEITQKYWDTIVRNGHERDFEILENI